MIAISYQTTEQLAEAQLLAEELSAPLLPPQADHPGPLLVCGTNGYSVLYPTIAKKPFRISFTDGPLLYRSIHSGKKQLIAKAVGLGKGAAPTILDVTAGWGRDGFILAALGCQVTLVERDPVVFRLLENALHRAADHPEIGGWIGQRISCFSSTGEEYLQQLSGSSNLPDVIYLDPMFPERKKKAAVKKDLQLLQSLVDGPGDDAEALLILARSCAKNRVVVKRPAHGPTLCGEKADITYQGDSTRFDVYLSLGK